MSNQKYESEMVLEECLLFEELTKKQEQIVRENKESLDNNESVEFEEEGMQLVIYKSESKCPVTGEDYFVIFEVV